MEDIDLTLDEDFHHKKERSISLRDALQRFNCKNNNLYPWSTEKDKLDSIYDNDNMFNIYSKGTLRPEEIDPYYTVMSDDYCDCCGCFIGYPWSKRRYGLCFKCDMHSYVKDYNDDRSKIFIEKALVSGLNDVFGNNTLNLLQSL